MSIVYCEIQNNNISVVSYKKNIENPPEYSYIIKDRNDNGFTYQLNDRYNIVWFNGMGNLFSTIKPLEENKVYFCNENMFGGLIRVFTNTRIQDKIDEAFTYIYYESTKELYCLALRAAEARFGGVVIGPNNDNLLVKKFNRHRYLMNKLRRLVPLIGKLALFFNQLYIEVRYRPYNSGAKEVLNRLNNYNGNLKISSNP